MSDKVQNKRLQQLPIGCDDFGKIISENLYFVDKSLLIQDLLDDFAEVALITRPRRFGKSLNLSMLRYFFAPEVLGRPTKGLFDKLNIAKAGDTYRQQQGKYPVIYLTLKGMTGQSFTEVYENLQILFSRAYDEHRILLDSPHLSDIQKSDFLEVLKRTANKGLLENALLNLSACLYQHYGEKVVILIDEYDAPIQSAYKDGFYEDMISFMRNLFGNGLKSNPYLYRAVLTGVLRVSRESLFSGLNNIAVYSMFKSDYGQYFGFTEKEVVTIFTESGLALELPEVRAWYNGYQIGEHTVYNPWSIITCIAEKGALRPYWVNTGGYDLLKSAIAKADADFKIKIESLLAGIPVQQLVDENFVFADLDNNEAALWSLLLASGYLKAIKAVPEEEFMNCTLLFPNYEVAIVYRSMFKEWFTNKMDHTGYERFLQELLTGNIEDFTKRLKAFLLESMSYFDVSGHQPEKFYHGFVLGLIPSLRDTYTIQSNRESGYGRYDVMIIPKDKSKLGIVLEFKTAEATEDLTMVAQQALQQVKDKQYETELRQTGIQSVLKLGFAFKGKDVVVVSE